MRVKIPPSEVIRQEIFGLLEQGLQTVGHPLEVFVNLAARLMLQVGLEKEVVEFLGRAYYQRQSRGREGWRNGYEPKRLKTSHGVLPLLVQHRQAF